MKPYDVSDYRSFIISGDIHGEFVELLYRLKTKKVTDSVILVAGDSGIGFEKHEYYRQLYNKLEKTLARINSSLLLLRGNHDDPVYFKNELLDFPRMKTIPDYSILKYRNKNILCVGGGISVDRIDRIKTMDKGNLSLKSKPVSYWKDEVPVYDKSKFLNLLDSKISVDTVITHTCPSFCFPSDKSGISSWLERDPQLAKDLTYERGVMDDIFNKLINDRHPLQEWYYGHFHVSHFEILKDIKFVALDIMELKEL